MERDACNGSRSFSAISAGNAHPRYPQSGHSPRLSEVRLLTTLRVPQARHSTSYLRFLFHGVRAIGQMVSDGADW